MRIIISFKHTTKDKKIYNMVNKQEEKSEFVKECIEYYMENFKEKE